MHSLLHSNHESFLVMGGKERNLNQYNNMTKIFLFLCFVNQVKNSFPSNINHKTKWRSKATILFLAPLSIIKGASIAPIEAALPSSNRMQGLIQGLRSCWQERIKVAILRKSGAGMFSRTCSMETEEKGLENTTVADVLMTKDKENVGSWICCRVNDNVGDAMKNMAQHNIGSLVVLKPGDQLHIAGIITERDYMRKIIGQGRSPIYTRVGEIMTGENKLITVKSDTSILEAMQLMTDNHIRHVPVIDGGMVGMVSIVDVVRTVVEQQNGELKRLNDFIKGDYY